MEIRKKKKLQINNINNLLSLLQNSPSITLELVKTF